MNNQSTALSIINQNESEKEINDANDWSDIFSNLAEQDFFDIKKDELATELAALMSFNQKNRSYIAGILNWKKSRVTQVLSGKANSTIRTIFDFCNAAGYEYDVIFRLPNEARPSQPWQKSDAVAVEPIIWDHSGIVFNVQSASQVMHDVYEGKAQSFYISINSNEHNEEFKYTDLINEHEIESNMEISFGKMSDTRSSSVYIKSL